MVSWGAIYANLVMATGWTWEYIDDFMTLPRLLDFVELWRDMPPVHMSVAALLGGRRAGRPRMPSGAPSAVDDKMIHADEHPELIIAAAAQFGGIIDPRFFASDTPTGSQ